MKVPEIYPPLTEYLEAIEAEIARLCGCDVPLVREGASRATAGRGKRLRPTLVKLSADAFLADGASSSAARDRLMGYGAVVEMIHTASLVHDDIVDEADLRRGLPSARSQWGDKISVLLGDFLLARGFHRMAEDPDPELQPILAAASATMCAGAVRELVNTGPDLTEEEYLAIIRGKTASLFAACTELGARLGGANAAQAAAMRGYGDAFGMAYQIADDVMDLAGDPAETGKPTGNDASQGKMTLAIIEALRRQPGGEADAVRAAIAREWSDADDADRIREFAQRAGGVAYAWRSAASYLARARQAIDGIHDSPARQALLTLCREGFPLPVMA